MRCRLVIAIIGLLFTGLQAFSTAPILFKSVQTNHPGHALALMPRGHAGNFWDLASPSGLIISDATDEASPSKVPHFTINADQTISWDDSWCIEAGGDKSGAAVFIKRCTGSQAQKWSWIPDGHGQNMVQLRGTNECLDVSDSKGDLRGAAVELRNCADTVSSSWRFQEPLANSQTWRHFTTYFVAFTGFWMLSLGAWLWQRHSKAAVVASSYRGASAEDVETGLSLAAPLTGHEVVGSWEVGDLRRVAPVKMSVVEAETNAQEEADVQVKKKAKAKVSEPWWQTWWNSLVGNDAPVSEPEAEEEPEEEEVDTRVFLPSGVEFTSLCGEDELPESMRRRFEFVCAKAQDEICTAIEALDGTGKFSYDRYSRASGVGGGIARVMTGGDVFEKVGVNLSVVYSEMPQEALQAATSRGADRVGVTLTPGEKVPFFACGISSVMHPKNPFCPTMHFNYRYFETSPLPREDGTESEGVWWFGGGTDITPSYIDVDDMKHFHGTYKAVCDGHNPEWYPRFKEWADRYFLIKHRGETRGLGGIFFDDFNEESPEEHLQFSTDCLEAVTKAYCPILEKNRDREFTDLQKNWQQMRRGRYVEFNLVYDRGTVFGLKMLASGVGRIESILMSLPETARWEYCAEPEPGTPEADLLDACRTPREWCIEEKIEEETEEELKEEEETKAELEDGEEKEELEEEEEKKEKVEEEEEKKEEVEEEEEKKEEVEAA